MKFKRFIAAVMAVTTMFGAMSINAGAAQPEAHISSTGAVYYDEDTTTDVEIISSRIFNQDGEIFNKLSLNVGVKVYLGNIFKLADGYDFDDFTYSVTDSQGDDRGAAKIVKSSGKYYLKAVKESTYEYLRVFYQKKLVATVQLFVNNDYESASKISISTKTPKIGQEMTLKALTSSNEYARCSWIIVGDSSWEFPAAWYTDWNTDKCSTGKATLSFNDFGKVKIYCLSPNGKLKKVTVNISEEVYDETVNYPDKTYFYDRYERVTVGYVKPDGSVVFTNKDYEDTWANLAYSWEKKCFYKVLNKGKATEKISWDIPRFVFSLS